MLLRLLALLCVVLCGAFQRVPREPSILSSRACVPHQPLHVRTRLPPLLLAKKKIPVLDDVLDYLTNMGGYTGFSEQDLKEGGGRLDQVDMETFGKDIETNDAVTTVFVLVLIAVPFIVGAIAFKLGLIQVPRFVPK
jgi:hypothetical protein